MNVPGYAPPMRQKHDPNMSVLAVLKKHGQEDMLDDLLGMIEAATSPGSLKREWIASLTVDSEGVSLLDPGDIDLKDSTTWGDIDDLALAEMPSDKFFLDVFRANVADNKRNARRLSYEF